MAAPDWLAQVLQEAAADLQTLFSKHTWRFFEQEYDTELWGKDDITISSVSAG